jgi:hypothetical protein
MYLSPVLTLYPTSCSTHKNHPMDVLPDLHTMPDFFFFLWYWGLNPGPQPKACTLPLRYNLSPWDDGDDDDLVVLEFGLRVLQANALPLEPCL